jgi:peptide/nickel transport system substrate-binding protein
MQTPARLGAGRQRLGRALLPAAALALLMLGPASATSSRYGGTLVVGLGSGDASSLDPTIGGGGGSRTVINAICLQLYAYAFNHGRLELADPVLAAAPPVLSADKLSVTVQLRQGLEFNDGTPLNAQAVIATYQRYISYPGSLWARNFADVADAIATGPYTVVFRLKQRDSTFLGNMYVLSPTALQSEGENFAANPVCVGPFMFDHRDAGIDVTLVKSPYWYKRSAVYLDKIVFKPYTDAESAAAALEAGDIQLLIFADPAVVPALREDSSLRVLSPPRFSFNGVRINIGNRNGVGNLPYTSVGTPLAQSAKLRQAFEEAIDRNALNKLVFGGLDQPDCTAIPPADTVVLPVSVMWSSSWRARRAFAGRSRARKCFPALSCSVQLASCLPCGAG